MSNKEILLILGGVVAFLWWKKNKAAPANGAQNLSAAAQNLLNLNLSYAPATLNNDLASSQLGMHL